MGRRFERGRQMGIYDRDYYRNDSGRYNPFDGRVRACAALIAIYIAVFVIQVNSSVNRRDSGPVTEFLELRTSKVLEGEVWRVATHAFAHNPSEIVPLVFNILFLIWFGRDVEDIYGWKEFLCYYLFAGLLAGLGFVLVAVISKSDITLLGPAGSITAVLFLFALHYPARTVNVFFVLPVPIWFLVAFYVLNDSLGFLTGTKHPAAFASHSVAAGFAFLYHRYSLRVSNWLPVGSSKGARLHKPKPSLKLFRDEPSENKTPPIPSRRHSLLPATAPEATAIGTATQQELDEHLEAKLDEVLEKVKTHGQASLTEEERAVLFRASEIYRKRRKKTGGN